MSTEKRNVCHITHKIVSGTAILKHSTRHSLSVRYKHHSMHSHRHRCSTRTFTSLKHLRSMPVSTGKSCLHSTSAYLTCSSCSPPHLGVPASFTGAGIRERVPPGVVGVLGL